MVTMLKCRSIQIQILLSCQNKLYINITQQQFQILNSNLQIIRFYSGNLDNKRLRSFQPLSQYLMIKSQKVKFRKQTGKKINILSFHPVMGHGKLILRVKLNQNGRCFKQYWSTLHAVFVLNRLDDCFKQLQTPRA